MHCIESPLQRLTVFGHACLLTDNESRGGLICWGFDVYNQLTDMPEDLSNISKLMVGPGNTCTVDDSGLRCWGRNEYNELDIPQDLGEIDAMSVGFPGFCAADSEKVRCWGSLDSSIKLSL